MKPRSMEEKISYLLFLMGFAGLLCTAALCIFVFHKAFRAQAWTALEREADLVAAGRDVSERVGKFLHAVAADKKRHADLPCGKPLEQLLGQLARRAVVKRQRQIPLRRLRGVHRLQQQRQRG